MSDFTKEELEFLKSEMGYRARYAPEENTEEEEVLYKSIDDKLTGMIKEFDAPAIIKEFIPLIEVNYGLGYYVDERHWRITIMPDGKDNGRERVEVEHNSINDMVYVYGYGKKTNINYVCKSDIDEVLYCVLTVIDQFRKDNKWTWKMPCEMRKENETNN